MNQIAAFNFQDFIFMAGDKLVTDSRSVAKAFNKAHKNVLRIIDGMRDSNNPIIQEHHRLNFEPMIFTVKTGKGASRTISGYSMTRDGFAELAMSFTGDASRAIRIQFIKAFNAMADFIRNGQMNLWKQMQDWTARNATSSIRASFGSHLMLYRKKDLPVLRSEYAILKDKIQPDMFAIK
ncbi:Rha family transcriptional regulator [Propionivibrio sp.]|uniref:Rha family transcriptional regulator n=1 Tax=Propionivibrio sp. TaxID=2212460 RepID=UPI003BF2594F